MSIDYQVPSSLPTTAGAQIYSFVGTAVAFSAGLAVAYTGCGIQNPASSKVKITVLKSLAAVTIAPAGTSVLGFGKLSPGTATLGTLSGVAGVITSPGISGTTTGVGLLFGTATVLNGTAGGQTNSLNYVSIQGVLLGTGASISQWITPAEQAGDVTLMPGESGMILSSIAHTGLPYLVWIETPIQ